MSEPTNQHNGFLQGPNGEFSSGRLMKLLSFLVASVITGVTLLLLARNPENSVLSNYSFGVAGLFLAVATGAEIAQRVTHQ